MLLQCKEKCQDFFDQVCTKPQIPCWKPFSKSQRKALIESLFASLPLSPFIDIILPMNTLWLRSPAMQGARKVSFPRTWMNTLQYDWSLVVHSTSFPPLLSCLLCREMQGVFTQGAHKIHASGEFFFFLSANCIRRHLVFLKPKVILKPSYNVNSFCNVATSDEQIWHWLKNYYVRLTDKLVRFSNNSMSHTRNVNNADLSTHSKWHISWVFYSFTVLPLSLDLIWSLACMNKQG